MTSADTTLLNIQIAQRIWTDVYGTDERQPTPEGYVHIGHIIPECLRKAYYNRVHPQLFFSLDTTMNFWYGRLLHARPLLADGECETELVWANIIGHIDEYCNGVLLEKKSTSHLPSTPYKIHVRQAEYYKVLLEKNGKPVKHTYIVYFLKDMSPVFPVALEAATRGTEFIAQEMLEKKNVVICAMQQQLLPAPTFGADCKYCMYTNKCFSSRIGGNKNHKLS